MDTLTICIFIQFSNKYYNLQWITAQDLSILFVINELAGMLCNVPTLSVPQWIA